MMVVRSYGEQTVNSVVVPILEHCTGSKPPGMDCVGEGSALSVTYAILWI